MYAALSPKVDDLQERFAYIESISVDQDFRELPSTVKALVAEINALRTKVEALEGKEREGSESTLGQETSTGEKQSEG